MQNALRRCPRGDFGQPPPGSENKTQQKETHSKVIQNRKHTTYKDSAIHDNHMLTFQCLNTKLGTCILSMAWRRNRETGKTLREVIRLLWDLLYKDSKTWAGLHPVGHVVAACWHAWQLYTLVCFCTAARMSVSAAMTWCNVLSKKGQACLYFLQACEMEG